MQPDLTKAQRMMVDDGLPESIIATTEDRAAGWSRRPDMQTSKPAPEGATQESTLKKTAPKKTAKTPKKASARKPAPKAARKAVKRPAPKKAKKSAPAGTRPDGLREGSKQAVMLDMALRPEGATEAAICKKLGWKKCRVTLKRTADRVGATLTKDDKGVWKAVMPSPVRQAAE